MPAVSVDQFLDALAKSNLLSADDLARVRDEAARDGAGVESTPLARKLVAQDLLTQWQAEMLLAGRHAFFLGRYKLLERIGSGGMGSVFKAQQEPLGRLVAVKVVSRKLMKNQESVARFYREIQAAASLDHPNIVAAYDADHAGKTYFLVMEYVDGEDLGSLIKRRGALPVGESCHYIRQAALGLQHAFERNLVHRDIKPANLLLSRAPGSHEPVVKLLDMGLARLTDAEAETELTHTGQIMGTPDYIAPEQARDSKAADIRSDVFSLGCTLFRLLTGQVPFGGTTLIEKLLARSESDAPPPSRFRPEVPPALDAVVARMVARDPNDRYATPAEVVAALAPFAHLSKESASLASAATAKSKARSPAVAPGPTAAGAADNTPTPHAAPDSGLQQFLHDLGSEASFMDVGSSSTQNAAGATPFAVGPAAGVPQGMPVFSPPVTDASGGDGYTASTLRRRGQTADRTARWLIAGGLGAFVLLVAAYFVWSWTGRTVLIVDWPAEERAGGSLAVNGHKLTLPQQGPIELPGEPGERTLRLTRAGYEPIEEYLRLRRGEVFPYRPQWRPTPQTVRHGELQTLTAEFESVAAKQHNEQVATPLRERLVDFRRRYPGTPEATEAAWLLWRLRWPVDELRREDVPEDERATASNVSPDASPPPLVAVLGQRGMAHHDRDASSVAFSPDGALLASSGHDQFIRLWDVATGNPVRAIDVGHWSCHSLCFSRDGRQLAAAYRDRTVGVWDVETGELVSEPAQHERNVFDVAFSPDGTLIASSDDTGARLTNAATGELLHSFPDQRWEVGFNPDGTVLVTVSRDNDGELNFWDTRTGEPVESKIQGRGYLGVAPSGVLVCRGEGNNMDVWEFADGGRHRLTIRPGGGWRPPAVSRDGRLVVTVLNNALAAFDAVTGERRAWSEADRLPHVNRVAISPDNKTIAAALRDGTIRLVDAETGRERFDSDGHRGLITSLAVSPDGRRIASAEFAGKVCLWDAATGKRLRRIEAHEAKVNAVRFLRSGKILATASDDRLIRLWDVKTGKLLRELDDQARPVLALAVHPDEDHLASAGRDRKIRIWDTRTGRLLQTLEGHAHDILCLAYSADGKLLVSGSQNAQVDGLMVWEAAAGRKSRTIKVADRNCKVVDVQFGIDGTQIVFVAKGGGLDGVRVWDLSKGRESREPYIAASDETCVDFQPQGHVFARSTGRGYLLIHNTRYGITQERWRFGGRESYFGDAVFTPDGRHVVTGGGGGLVYVLRLREWQPEMERPSDKLFP